MESNASFDDNGLLYVNKNSLSKELCEEMISYFESDTHTYPGVTASGLNHDIKDTTDLVISHLADRSPWDIINKTLAAELKYNIKVYIDGLAEKCDTEYDMFDACELFIPTIQMQKYNKNVGKYVYHNDYSCDFATKHVRQITFLWYINDVEEGGETEFWKNQKVKPEAGKLVLFPAHWTFPHKANKPVSDNKYIITGWIYEIYTS